MYPNPNPVIDFANCPMWWWQVRLCFGGGPDHRTYVRAADYEAAKMKAVKMAREIARKPGSFLVPFRAEVSPQMERGLVKRHAFAGYGDE